MVLQDPKQVYSAVNDFRKARNRAILKEIIARFTGESTELLSYEDVRQKLKGRGSADQGLKEIPLNAIIGSAGRYSDFTRDFLPRLDANKDRWARVKVAQTGSIGLPPIEVYQIGEAYFVKDGNHRVSVARQLSATHIQAYVNKVRTRVPLPPDTHQDDVILMAEYTGFLEHTHLDELRSDVDLRVTAPGKYQVLEEHISVHRYFMGIDQNREISYEEAVTHWYDVIYMPVVGIIRDRGILRDFPDRTEADLYLWIANHRSELEHVLGWDIKQNKAITDLVDQFSPNARNLVTRISEKLRDVIIPDKFETGPHAGQWRKEVMSTRRDERLILDILVPVSGETSGWFALEQALVVARREGANLLGLHIVRNEVQKENEAALAVQNQFDQRCAEANIPGNLVITVGEISRQICTRSRWADLIVTNLAHPPGGQLARLESGFRAIIQLCSRPILATPQTTSSLKRALLAFDGSPKSEEALFVATYISGQWQIPLDVITVLENEYGAPEMIDRAKRYLEAHGVSANYITGEGPVVKTILNNCESRECDLLIMGGYGSSPLVEFVLGSVVDQVLRESHIPTLICR